MLLHLCYAMYEKNKSKFVYFIIESLEMVSTCASGSSQSKI